MKATDDREELIDQIPEPIRSVVRAMPRELRDAFLDHPQVKAKLVGEESEPPRVIVVQTPCLCGLPDCKSPTAVRVVIRKGRGTWSIETQHKDALGEPVWIKCMGPSSLREGMDAATYEHVDRLSAAVEGLANRVAELEDELAD